MGGVVGFEERGPSAAVSGHLAEGDHGEGGVGGLYPIVVVVGVVVWGHTISEAGAWDGACGGLKDTEDALEGGFDGREIADIEADQGGFGGVVGFARAGVGAEVSGRDRGEQAASAPDADKAVGCFASGVAVGDKAEAEVDERGVEVGGGEVDEDLVAVLLEGRFGEEGAPSAAGRLGGGGSGGCGEFCVVGLLKESEG